MFRNLKCMYENRGGSPTHLIVGLGNPGPKYDATRHNIGFMVLDKLAESLGTEIKKIKFKATTADVTFGGERCILLKPQTFMNVSGEAVAGAARFYKIEPENIIVLYDDALLDIGTLRIRSKGSDGGHNGMKSIVQCLGSSNFPRVRIGVGKRPHPDYDLADWVLSHFQKKEEDEMTKAAENAIEATKLIVAGKTEEAMNRYN